MATKEIIKSDLNLDLESLKVKKSKFSKVVIMKINKEPIQTPKQETIPTITNITTHRDNVSQVNIVQEEIKETINDIVKANVPINTETQIVTATHYSTIDPLKVDGNNNVLDDEQRTKLQIYCKERASMIENISSLKQQYAEELKNVNMELIGKMPNEEIAQELFKIKGFLDKMAQALNGRSWAYNIFHKIEKVLTDWDIAPASGATEILMKRKNVLVSIDNITADYKKYLPKELVSDEANVLMSAAMVFKEVISTNLAEMEAPKTYDPSIIAKYT